MERRSLRPGGSRVDARSGRAGPQSGAGLVLVTEDREWLDRIRGGNQIALEALFRSHVRGLTAFAHRYVQSLSGAQEVVQDVFVRLWEGRHSWAFHGTVRGYLFASAHRVSLEALRRMHREARWHAGLPPDDAAIARDAGLRGLDPAGPEELRASVAVAIARLPARARTVALMRWGDRLSRSEIATVLGINARTVHSQVTPAARAMRERLAGPGGGADAWSITPSTREATDAVDRFTTIDPDRLEEFLAGECIPAEEVELHRDVVEAGGEPGALDAMRAAWVGPCRAVEDLVDEDAAWRPVARRLSIAHDEAPTRRTWTIHFPPRPDWLRWPRLPTLPARAVPIVGVVSFIALAIAAILVAGSGHRGAGILPATHPGMRTPVAGGAAPKAPAQPGVQAPAGAAASTPSGRAPTASGRHHKAARTARPHRTARRAHRGRKGSAQRAGAGAPSSSH